MKADDQTRWRWTSSSIYSTMSLYLMLKDSGVRNVAARASVGVAPIALDDTVAAYASDCANQRAADCSLVDSGGAYGENISGGSMGGDWTASDAVSSWVSEQQYYDYNSNTCADGHVCGHYTQVVWANSVKLGCARVVCNNGGVFITCNYDPPGNFVGDRPY
ncbi:pathogenesis-related protein PRB1-3-like [Canna indica]|uniref:Pathogenesis-related protein PRB1-3-like n=1 Tax=Canna indica TaxID=4628 RepID=A0AAQ3KS70_9LILI|nr:pathogenesis-related protein PRB1-3-like [Canna indica]